MDIAELVQQLQTLGEQDRIEAKTCSQVGKSVLESICAFANEPDLLGGYLLLGLNKPDDHKNYHIVGIDNPEKILLHNVALGLINL